MAIAGKNGKLQIGDSTPITVVGIKNWSLDLSLDTLDTTTLGKDWKEYITGLKEWHDALRKYAMKRIFLAKVMSSSGVSQKRRRIFA